MGVAWVQMPRSLALQRARQTRRAKGLETQQTVFEILEVINRFTPRESVDSPSQPQAAKGKRRGLLNEPTGGGLR